MRRQIYKNIVFLTICIAVFLTSIPMQGYGSELPEPMENVMEKDTSSDEQAELPTQQPEEKTEEIGPGLENPEQPPETEDGITDPPGDGVNEESKDDIPEKTKPPGSLPQQPDGPKGTNPSEDENESAKPPEEVPQLPEMPQESSQIFDTLPEANAAIMIPNTQKANEEKEQPENTNKEPSQNLEWSTNSSSIDSKLKKRYSAKITKTNIVLPASVFTTYDTETSHYVISKDYGVLMKSNHGDWASVSELTNFWDHKGLPNIVCASDEIVYITRYGTDFKAKSIVKINKKYPLLGDVVCDKKGNYYLIWGEEDSSGKGNCVTMAVSKYTYSGKLLKTVQYKTASSQNHANSFHTRIPFDAGNCSTVITDNVLVCQYAREMYNGHQSSDVIAVNTINMTKNTEYKTYTSHSFDQRVIALKDGGVCYADHGDAYPRGFHITFSKSSRKEQTPFHFYGKLDSNDTNAWLGGICETDMGIFLVGASGKSLKTGNQGKNLFIQLVDEKMKISGSKIRKGTCGDEDCIDQGVKWLTNYSSAYDIANPKVVKTTDERMVVLWEKFKKDTFIQSYYMVLGKDGTILLEATPMQKTRLASFEEPLYKNGNIYWITAGKIEPASKNGYFGYQMTQGTKAVVNCLEVGTLVKNN